MSAELLQKLRDVAADARRDGRLPPERELAATLGVGRGQLRGVLAKLEAGREATGGLAAGLDDLPLFAATLVETPAAAKDALREALAGFDPDALAPREALDALYALKRLMADET